MQFFANLGMLFRNHIRVVGLMYIIILLELFFEDFITGTAMPPL